MSIQPQTRKQQHQRGIHLSDQGWAYLATRHADIKVIAFGGLEADSELVRAVFAYVDCELPLKRHEAEASR